MVKRASIAEQEFSDNTSFPSGQGMSGLKTIKKENKSQSVSSHFEMT